MLTTRENLRRKALFRVEETRMQVSIEFKNFELECEGCE